MVGGGTRLGNVHAAWTAPTSAMLLFEPTGDLAQHVGSYSQNDWLGGGSIYQWPNVTGQNPRFFRSESAIENPTRTPLFADAVDLSSLCPPQPRFHRVIWFAARTSKAVWVTGQHQEWLISVCRDIGLPAGFREIIPFRKYCRAVLISSSTMVMLKR